MELYIKDKELFLKTDIEPSKFKFVNVAEVLAENGFYADQYNASQWHFQDVSEENNIFCMRAKLPFLTSESKVQTLREALHEDQTRLIQLRHYLSEINERNLLDNYLSPARCFYIDDVFVFLPESILKISESSLGLEYQNENVVGYQPRQNVNLFQRISFFYISMVYETIMQQPLFYDKTYDLSAQRVLKQWFVPLPPWMEEYFQNDIKGTFTKMFNGDALVSSLSYQKAWTKFDLWIKEHNFQNDKIQEYYTQNKVILDKKIAKTRHFNHFRLHYIVGISLFLFIAINTFNIIKKAYTPTEMSNLSSAEIVALYYKSINDLDEPTLSELIARGGPKMDSSVVTQLYVIDKVRQGYEGKRDNYITPAHWIEMGSLPLEEGTQVWGLTNLMMHDSTKADIEHSMDTHNCIFIVDYYRWYTEVAVRGEKVVTTIYKVKLHDRVLLDYLERQETWLISQIFRTEYPLEEVRVFTK